MCVVLFVQKFGFLQKTAVNSGREMETETERDTERQRQRRRETETEGGRETETREFRSDFAEDHMSDHQTQWTQIQILLVRFLANFHIFMPWHEDILFFQDQ